MTQTVLIISTGGTIASFQTQEGYFSVAQDHLDNPLNDVIKTSAQAFNQHIIHEQPLSLLSETMMPNHWLMIAHAVRHVIKKHKVNQSIDRIIITHGSDTLAYTASALAFLLADIQIPILMVAALQSPNEKNSDALINIRAALMYAQLDLDDSVYVVFSNAEKKVALFSAVLSDNIPSYAHHLPTLEHKAYTALTVDEVHQKKLKNRHIKKQPKNNDLNEQTLSSLTELNSGVVKLFHVYPGMIAEDVIHAIQYTPQCKAVLLNLYHSGTASSEGHNNLLPLLAHAKENNVLVFGLPFDGLHETGKQYETTHALLNHGLIPLPVMSITTAYTKLMVMAHVYLQEKNATHHLNQNIKNIMSINMLGEHV